jgi:phosphate transport system protein
MSLHLQRDLAELRKDVLQLGSMVEASCNDAILALTDRRPELAARVFSNEDLIDEREVQIEESCLKMLALHQPVAIDLRFIVVALKVNNDLERMGDFAVNVASRAVYLETQLPFPGPWPRVNIMHRCIRRMIRSSLDSLVKLDTEIARDVIRMDDEVDEANRQMYVELQALMERDSSMIGRAISLLSASRHLERIADLATNIAEDVIFMVDGEVVRHT